MWLQDLAGSMAGRCGCEAWLEGVAARRGCKTRLRGVAGRCGWESWLDLVPLDIDPVSFEIFDQGKIGCETSVAEV